MTCVSLPAHPGLLFAVTGQQGLWLPDEWEGSWPLRWSNPAGVGVASLPLGSLFAAGVGGFYFLWKSVCVRVVRSWRAAHFLSVGFYSSWCPFQGDLSRTSVVCRRGMSVSTQHALLLGIEPEPEPEHGPLLQPGP